MTTTYKAYVVANNKTKAIFAKQLSQHSGHWGARVYKTLGGATRFAAANDGSVFTVYLSLRFGFHTLSDDTIDAANIEARKLGLMAGGRA